MSKQENISAGEYDAVCQKALEMKLFTASDVLAMKRAEKDGDAFFVERMRQIMSFFTEKLSEVGQAFDKQTQSKIKIFVDELRAGKKNRWLKLQQVRKEGQFERDKYQEQQLLNKLGQNV